MDELNLKELIDLVNNTPNDSELGKRIRELITNYKTKHDEFKELAESIGAE